MKPIVNPFRKLGRLKKRGNVYIFEPGKKKKRYSKRNKDLAKYAEAMQDLQTGMAKAKLKELKKLSRSSDKSSYKKKDGALRDSLKNYRKAMRVNKKYTEKATDQFFDTVSDLKMVRQFERLF